MKKTILSDCIYGNLYDDSITLINNKDIIYDSLKGIVADTTTYHKNHMLYTPYSFDNESIDENFLWYNRYICFRNPEIITLIKIDSIGGI